MYHADMRPHGSPEELERRRRRAIQILQQGATVTEVARRIGCSHSSVILWRRMLRRRGTAGLKAQPAPGRPTRLEARQVRRLPALLRKGALAWGYTTRIAEVIRREFGIRFHRAHVGRLLAQLDGSCQKPNAGRSNAMRRRSPSGT